MKIIILYYDVVVNRLQVSSNLIFDRYEVSLLLFFHYDNYLTIVSYGGTL